MIAIALKCTIRDFYYLLTAPRTVSSTYTQVAREADIQMFLNVPGITSKEQLPGELRNLKLALIADRFPHTAWTQVYTDGSAEVGMKNGGSGVYIRW